MSPRKPGEVSQLPVPVGGRLVKGDALEEMSKLEDGSVGLVVTSPPYNLSNTSGGGLKGAQKVGKWASAKLADGYDTHDDKMPHSDYVEWQRAILRESMRVLSDDGAIFYNHKWRVQKGLIQDRSDIVEGFPVRQIIIWQRKGGINFNEGYFLPTYEVVYMIAKPKFKLAPKANAFGDVWSIGQEMNNPHPAPYPVELAERIIGSTTAEVVLDPFIGSGTTAIAALNLGRQFIGFDSSGEYIAMAHQRIQDRESPV